MQIYVDVGSRVDTSLSCNIIIVSLSLRKVQFDTVDGTFDSSHHQKVFVVQSVEVQA